MRMPKAVNQTYDTAMKELVDKQKQKRKPGQDADGSPGLSRSATILLVIGALVVVGILMRLLM